MLYIKIDNNIESWSVKFAYGLNSEKSLPEFYIKSIITKKISPVEQPYFEKIEKNKYIYINMSKSMKSFIDRTKIFEPPILYRMTKVLIYNKKGNCLSLGPGAGNAELELLKLGWHVTAVDKEIYSYETMREQTKSKKLEFINIDFNDLKLTKKYDYVIAINSIPFMDKKNIDDLFEKIFTHSKKECTITMTFFGTNHTFVKHGGCFGMTTTEVKKLFKKYKINIKLLGQTATKRPDGVNFDVINVIGVKSDC